MDAKQQHGGSYQPGAVAEPGSYKCESCGHVLKLKSQEKLPTCPEEDGHHAIKAWHRCDAEGAPDCDELPGPFKDVDQH